MTEWERRHEEAGGYTGFTVAARYRLRFVKPEDEEQLLHFYRLARVALSGLKPATKYNRMIWASGEFVKAHDYISSTGAYKDLCGLLD